MRFLVALLLVSLGCTLVFAGPDVDRVSNTQIAKANLEQIGEGNERNAFLDLRQAQLAGFKQGSILTADQSSIAGVQEGILTGVLGVVGGRSGDDDLEAIKAALIKAGAVINNEQDLSLHTQENDADILTAAKNLGDLWGSILESGLNALNFPITNQKGKTWKDKTEFLQDLLDQGSLKSLPFPINDASGQVLENKKTFIEALLNVKFLKGLRFPLTNANGKVVFKDSTALLEALFDAKALVALSFPLSNSSGEVFSSIKDVLRVFAVVQRIDGALGGVIGIGSAPQGVSSTVSIALEPLNMEDNLDALIELLIKGGAILKDQDIPKPNITVPKGNITLDEVKTSLGDLLLTSNPVLKFPLVDINGNILKNKVDMFLTFARQNTLTAFKFPLKDGKSNVIEDGIAFMRIILNNTYNDYKFPLTDKVGMKIQNKYDFVEAQVKGSSLANLKYPLTDNKGVQVKDLKAFAQGLIDDNLSYPLTDKTGFKITDLVEVMRTIYNYEALSTFKFPITEANGHVLKDMVDLFLPMANTGLSNFNFPITNAEGKVLKDTNDLIKSLLSLVVSPEEIIQKATELINESKASLDDQLLEAAKQALANIQDSLAALILSNVEAINFPITDKAGKKLKDKIDLILDVISSKALASLKFPLNDNKGFQIKDQEDLLEKIFDKVFDSLRFPLNTKSGSKINSKAELLDLLFNASKLSKLKFPLAGVKGLQLKDKKAFLQAFINNNLEFPLNDQASPKVVLKDLSELWSIIFSSEAYQALDYPLTQANGLVFKDKIQLYIALTNSGIKALNFPITTSDQKVFKDIYEGLNFLLRAVLPPSELVRMAGDLLRNSKDLLLNLPLKKPIDLSQAKKTLTGIKNSIGYLLLTNDPVLSFPLTATSGKILNDKVDLFMSMIGDNALQELKFPLTDNEGSEIKDHSSILRKIFDNAYNDFVFPLKNINGYIWPNKTGLCDCQILGSPLGKLTYPLTDAKGGLIKTDLAFLKGLMDDTLHFPLTDKLGIVLNDLGQILRIIFSGEALSTLKYPITQGNGQVLSNKVDVILSNFNSGAAGLKFPLTNSKDGKIEDINDMMKTLLDVVVEPEKLSLKIIKNVDVLLNDDQYLFISQKLAQLCSFSECGKIVLSQNPQRAQVLKGILELLEDIMDLSNCNNFSELTRDLDKFKVIN